MFPNFHAADLILSPAEVDELETVFAIGAEFLYQAGSGALRGRGGIVELVGEIAGKLAQRTKFFRLLLNARDFADAVKERGDNPLGHGRNGFEHRREVGVVDGEGPDGGNGDALAAECLHARKGE